MPAKQPNLSADGLVIFDVYVDESSQTKCRYLVLGGLIVPKSDVEGATKALMNARNPELPRGELKWGKVSKAKLEAYKRFVDAFFDDIAFARVKFHSLAEDTSKVDDKAYNSGSREIGFNKEIYQLAVKFARLQKDGVFHLYPDYRDTNQRPEDLRNILNHGRHKDRDGRSWPFRRCQFRDSAKVPLLQLVDLFVGAIAFGKNEHFKNPDASPAKVELGRHIMRRAGIRTLAKDTVRDGRFTIWHRVLRPRKGVLRD
jgi:hypothetical protein